LYPFYISKAIALEEETMQNETLHEDFESFQFFLSKITPAKRSSTLYYYPEKALLRIREGQMALFHEECEKEGLITKQNENYVLTQKGMDAVRNSDSNLLLSVYYRAKKRINLLYVDVLI
jgi:hypothetical protein